MLIIIIMNIIKIFSDARAMARLGPGPAPPLGLRAISVLGNENEKTNQLTVSGEYRFIFTTR